MFKRIFSMTFINFFRVVGAIQIGDFFSKEKRKWYIYAAPAICFILLPIAVEATPPDPVDMGTEFNHSGFVTAKGSVDNITVAIVSRA